MKFQCHLMCIDDNNIYENGKYCRPQYDNAALQKWYFKKMASDSYKMYSNECNKNII